MLGTTIRLRDRGGETAVALLHTLDRAAADYGVPLDELPEVIAAREIVDRAAAIRSRLHLLRNADGDTASRLATALLDGDVDDDELLDAAARHRAAAEPGSLLYSVGLSVEATANGRAMAKLRTPGDRWVVEVFGPAIAEVVDELTQLAQAIPTSVGDRTVHEQPPPVRRAWQRAVELLGTFYGLNAAVDDLRRAGAVPCAQDVADSAVYWFRSIALLPQHVRVSSSPTLWALDAIRQGAQPGCLTDAELHARDAEPVDEPEPAA